MAVEELSSYSILTKLNTARAYAVTKGNELLDAQSDGDETCEKQITELKLLNSLIDSIDRYSTIYVKPSIWYTVVNPVSGATVSIVFDGVSLGSVVMVSATASGEAAEIANYVNSLGGIYTATANTNYLTFYASDGSLSNGVSSSVTGNNGMIFGVPFPTVFSSDGRDYFSENTDRCLTDEQIDFILTKIRRITPSCSNVTSFSQNSLLASLPDIVYNIFVNGIIYETLTFPVTEGSVTVNIID